MTSLMLLVRETIYFGIIMKTTVLLFVLVVIVIGCPDNCLYCQNSAQCTACLNSYSITLNGACIMPTIKYCRVYKNTYACSICQPTFKLMGNNCVKDYSGCTVRDSTGNCQFCSFGTKLKSNECTGILNCKTMGSNAQCTQCFIGYKLQFGACAESRNQCANISAGVCIECKPKYVINGFSCLLEMAIPPLCSLFDYRSGRCMICAIGYQMYQGYCQQLDRISKKLQTQSKGTISGTNSLAWNDEYLTNDPVSAVNYKALDDGVVRIYNDIQINTFVGSGNLNVKDSCWQPAKTGGCAVCRQGYNLFRGNCVAAAPLCLKFDKNSTFKCLQCTPMLTLKDSSCVDVNCAVALFSRCQVCINANFQPNSQGICNNAYCVTMINGSCIQCATGFTLTSNKLCINSTNLVTIPKTNTTTNTTSQSTTTPSTVPPIVTIKGCDLIVGSICARCGQGFYPNNKGGCKKVIIGCLTMDASQLNCLQCMGAYTPTADGGCSYIDNTVSPTTTATPNNTNTGVTNSQVSPSAPISTNTVQTSKIDINCNIPNIGSCAVCKQRFILNSYNFTCMKIPNQCLTYNPTSGACLSCAQTYILFQLWCLPRYTKTDPNCAIYDINNYCTNCKSNYYKTRGLCYQVNSQCKTFNVNGGDCLSCYSGYMLFNGQCVLMSQQPNCAEYDYQANCIACLNRYYLSVGVCVPVSPLCKRYSNVTGVCTDCIDGFGISSVTQECLTVKPAPTNCQNADSVGLCLACIARFYLISDTHTCMPVSALCQNYTAVGGKCLSCFAGYKLLQDGSCIKNVISSGCLTATAAGLCATCAAQFVLNSVGSCQNKDPNCVGFSNGVCSKCSTFYYLASGSCVKQTLKSKDANCVIHDIYNYCQTCNFGFYISAGNCILADQQCKTFDTSNGNCLTCYDGYRIYNNKCYLNNPIFNCKMFGGSICIQCQTGYVVGLDGSCSK